MQVYFSHLGCKLNHAELQRLARQFQAAGHRVVDRLEEAELHVINTCTVTHLAARDSRKLARRGRRVRPQVKTVLTGCYATGSRHEAERLAGVDLVVGNEQKEELLELVHRVFPGSRPEPPLPVSFVPLPFGTSRAALKVEDGCNMRCAFCIIPLTRGRQRSRTPEELVDEVQGLAASGIQEVVITGVQISSYRHGSSGLYELVRTLLEETTVARFRLSSIAPWQLDRRLLELWPSPRLCRHFHFSLQSGCDATLRRMRRPYSVAAFAGLVGEVRQAIPGVAITSDVIVGFPGETESELAESLAFVAETGFARLHVFSYSARPGTTAASMPDQIDAARKKTRVARMREVAAAGERRFWEERLGQIESVLWEERRGGRWRGMTDNYIRVTAESAGTGTAGERPFLEPACLLQISDGSVIATRP